MSIFNAINRLYRPSYSAGTGFTKQVSTGRYNVTARENHVRIYDRQSNTWTQYQNVGNKVLMTTSDGNKAYLNRNATIDLQDGSKVTLGVGRDGRMDSVSVMKNGKAKVISGLSDGRLGVQKSRMLDGYRVDAWQNDGTVLQAGRQVDDLYSSQTGRQVGMGRRYPGILGRIFGRQPQYISHLGGQSRNLPEWFSHRVNAFRNMLGGMMNWFNPFSWMR